MAGHAPLFVLLSLAQADAASVCWEAKYRYNLWRPVTAIQRADEEFDNLVRFEDDVIEITIPGLDPERPPAARDQINLTGDGAIYRLTFRKAHLYPGPPVRR